MTSWALPALFFALILSSCTPNRETQQIPRVASNQITKVRFQQIVLPFKEIDPTQTRTQEETKVIAERLFSELLKKPELFMDYVRQYSDDPFPATYTLVNYGQSPIEGERERDDFVVAISRRVFELKVGEIDLIPYDKEECPAGYHLVMRLPS
jgi:hypothetical protein